MDGTRSEDFITQSPLCGENQRPAPPRGFVAGGLHACGPRARRIAKGIGRLRAGDLIAGRDVVDPEPLQKDSPLRALPNAFITPHIAWHAPNALHRYFSTMALEFDHFF